VADYDPSLPNARAAYRRLKARMAEALDDSQKIDAEWEREVKVLTNGIQPPYPGPAAARARGEAFAYGKALDELIDLFGPQIEE
jgi:hypothetical protein